MEFKAKSFFKISSKNLYFFSRKCKNDKNSEGILDKKSCHALHEFFKSRSVDKG